MYSNACMSGCRKFCLLTQAFVLSSRFPIPNSLATPAGIRTIATSPTNSKQGETPIHPCFATTGRWLRDDDLQQKARVINFDFAALCSKVVELCAASSIQDCTKLEGGFNRVFIFTLDNKKRVVARLPTSVAGPPRLITNSEVATISYLKSKTSIPIPEILDWNDNPSNSIGSEYIIMEHSSGVSLRQKWPQMTGPQQVSCIRSISLNIKQMVELKFPAYGSLYFADTPLLDEGSKLKFTEKLCIGPHCGIVYWDSTVNDKRFNTFGEPNRGPWLDLSAYCSGLIDTGLSRLPSHDADLPSVRKPYQGTVSEHVDLLKKGRAVLSKLITDPRLQNSATPTLLHPDLHTRNIFVAEDDPTQVTGIIDWQSTSVEPLFYHADYVPDFASPIIREEDEGEESEKSDQEKEEIRLSHIGAQTFDVCMKALVPTLDTARSLDSNLLRVFRYCHRTWRDGIPAFRHELMELAGCWEQLQLPGTCPYPIPTGADLELHKRQFGLFENAIKLRAMLAQHLAIQEDGWVPKERWDEVQEACKVAFDVFRQNVRMEDEPEFTEKDFLAVWPYDLKKEWL